MTNAGERIAELEAKLAVLEAENRRVREVAESHNWYCGCGHWNGANLAVCAVCGRKPGDR